MQLGPVESQTQMWVLHRIHRICRRLFRSTHGTACLEQYERHVALLFGQSMTPEAAAWIEVIVEHLRSGEPFRLVVAPSDPEGY